MNKCPCHGCNDRQLGCRKDCKNGWAEWEKEHNAERDRINQERDINRKIDDYIIRAKIKRKKEKRK